MVSLSSAKKYLKSFDKSGDDEAVQSFNRDKRKSMNHDESLKSKFEPLLDQGEHLIWVSKPKFNSFVSNMLFIAIISGLLMYGVFEFNRYAAEEKGYHFTYILLFFAVMFVPGIFSFIGQVLSYRNTLYAYSNHRVLMSGGFLTANFKMIDYENILDIEIKESLVDKMYQSGTIKFFSGRTKTDDDDRVTKLYDDWIYIDQPYEVLKSLRKAMNEKKNERKS